MENSGRKRKLEGRIIMIVALRPGAKKSSPLHEVSPPPFLLDILSQICIELCCVYTFYCVIHLFGLSFPGFMEYQRYPKAHRHYVDFAKPTYNQFISVIALICYNIDKPCGTLCKLNKLHRSKVCASTHHSDYFPMIQRPLFAHNTLRNRSE